MVILCEKKHDASRVYKALIGRAHRFGLKLNEGKTKIVPFSRQGYGRGEKQGTFDFLGFTFYMGKSRKGKALPKLKTSFKNFSSKLKNVEIWCQRARDLAGIRALWCRFFIKLQGHINYYGVFHNVRKVGNFIHKARRVFFKWMNRRSQRRSMSRDKFLRFEEQFPPPQAAVKYALF